MDSSVSAIFKIGQGNAALLGLAAEDLARIDVLEPELARHQAGDGRLPLPGRPEIVISMSRASTFCTCSRSFHVFLGTQHFRGQRRVRGQPVVLSSLHLLQQELDPLTDRAARSAARGACTYAEAHRLLGDVAAHQLLRHVEHPARDLRLRAGRHARRTLAHALGELPLVPRQGGPEAAHERGQSTDPRSCRGPGRLAGPLLEGAQRARERPLRGGSRRVGRPLPHLEQVGQREQLADADAASSPAGRGAGGRRRRRRVLARPAPYS